MEVLYHGSGVAVALVHHLDRRSPDVLCLALLHLSTLLPTAEQLLDSGRGGTPEGAHVERGRKVTF